MTLTIASSTSPQPLPRTWIERLFDKMLLSYGKKFTDQWMSADPDKLIAHWAEELATLSREELSRGYAALEARDWPPSLPEFKRMCRPPLDPLAAYYEAINGLQAREKGEVGTWSHPAIFWAAVAVSTHDLKNQPYSQIKARWESALQAEMAKGQWEPIPAPLVALPAPGMTKTDRDTAAKRMNELQSDAGVKLADKTDHRAWIGKILERQKRGDTTLPGIAVRFAKEALASKEAA